MKYHFEVKTADQYLAGTDANIFVRMYGERGISKSEIRLNGYIPCNAFERNSLDKFDITLDEDLGDIYMIDVRSDNSYAAAGWLCSYFEITRKKPDEKGKEVSGAKVTFSLPSGEWIEDTNVHQYKATDGYPLNVPEHTEQLVKVALDTHFVPANAEMQITCETTLKVAVDYTKVKVVDNTTKVSVAVATNAIQTAIENQLKLSLSKQLHEHFERPRSFTATMIVQPMDRPRAFREIWYETDYNFAAEMGEDTYLIMIPYDRLFYGLEEVDLTEQMIQMIALNGQNDLKEKAAE